MQPLCVGSGRTEGDRKVGTTNNNVTIRMLEEAVVVYLGLFCIHTPPVYALWKGVVIGKDYVFYLSLQPANTRVGGKEGGEHGKFYTFPAGTMHTQQWTCNPRAIPPAAVYFTYLL